MLGSGASRREAVNSRLDTDPAPVILVWRSCPEDARLQKKRLQPSGQKGETNARVDARNNYRGGA